MLVELTYDKLDNPPRGLLEVFSPFTVDWTLEAQLEFLKFHKLRRYYDWLVSKGHLPVLPMRRVKLDSSNLSQATFPFVDLTGSSFFMADLSKTKFMFCCLEACYFRQASFVGARFVKCSFNGSCLDEVNIQGAHLYECNFIDSTAREMRGVPERVEAVIVGRDYNNLKLVNNPREFLTEMFRT